jgi:ubiquinone biosynthesis protein UbiJ
VHIEGDVQLAADINWLADHVRWDVQEDLSRLLGDAPAHQLVQLAGQLHRSLRAWLARRGPAQATGGAA